MTARRMLPWLIAGALAGSVAMAQDQTRDRDQTSDQIRESDIYGSQMMTTQERNEYRTRMQAAKTTQEREQIRAEHHERMKMRAKDRGVTLPDAPPQNRGPGSGMGGGAGGGGGSGK